MHNETSANGPGITGMYWREVAKIISLNVVASYELCRNAYLQSHAWCLQNTLQSTLQSEKHL